jgi:hypothetical protein
VEQAIRLLALGAAILASTEAAGSQKPSHGATCLRAIEQYAPQLLESYRFPCDKDITDYWQYELEEYGKPSFCASADFNSDGHPDYAVILLGRTSAAFALYGLVSKDARRILRSYCNEIPERYSEPRKAPVPSQQADLGLCMPAIPSSRNG